MSFIPFPPHINAFPFPAATCLRSVVWVWASSGFRSCWGVWIRSTGPCLCAEAANAINPLGTEEAAFPCQGQAGHPHLRQRRTQPGRYVRPETLARQIRRANPPTRTSEPERKTGAAVPSPFKFKKYGQSGLEVSEIFANTAKHIDDICVIRSMHADVPNHEPSFLLMRHRRTSTDSSQRGFVGVTMDSGTENQNLPGFVNHDVSRWLSAAGIAELAGGFPSRRLPGHLYRSRHTDVEKLIEYREEQDRTRGPARKQLDLLAKLNELHQSETPQRPATGRARIQSFELAYRMQTEAARPSTWPASPNRSWKPMVPASRPAACFLARRLVERGVRFVQVSHGPVQPWDSHENIAKEHKRLADQTDRAIAAAFRGPETTGLFESTLIIWGGEFGHALPTVELPSAGTVSTATGRDHNHWGFRCGWRVAG